jgi:hypothetical protein
MSFGPIPAALMQRAAESASAGDSQNLMHRATAG